MHNSITTARRAGLMLLALIALLLSMAPTARAAVVARAEPPIIPPQSHAYGATYGEWSARWWQWTFKLPVADRSGVITHPLFVDGAVDCSYGQSGHVWFLGGTFVTNPDPVTNNVVGTATRSCTIPAGTALFFPILNSEQDIIGPDGTPTHLSVAELRQLAKQSQDAATNLSAVIDGRPVKDLARYRVQSPVFALTLPKNNLYTYFGYPVSAGRYSPAVADGVFLMLAPLPIGQHTIAFHGEAPGFMLTVTYHLTVRPQHDHAASHSQDGLGH